MKKKGPRTTGVLLFPLLASLWLSACDASDVGGGRGKLKISSRPSGAVLTCNGTERGITPLALTRLPEGEHLLILRKEGFHDFHHTVTVLGGQESFLEINLEPVTGLLLIESAPSGAEITLNGDFKGVTPALLDGVPVGTHRIELRAQGWAPRTLSVPVPDRRPQRVFAELATDAGRMTVRSRPAGAAVTVNGSASGTTPLDELRVRSGSAQIEISAPGYLPHIRSLTVRAGEDYTVEATLQPLPSGLTLSVPDGRAQVFLNNQYKGETPLSLGEMEEGLYEIRLEMVGYEPLLQQVRLVPGRTEFQEFRMQKNSGDLVLVTAPAGVQVFLNGDLKGVTRARESTVVSEPFMINLIPHGNHTLQLVHKGFRPRQKAIQIKTGEVTSLHEDLERFFIPDTRVITDNYTYIGVLLKRHPGGDIELETLPNIVEHIKADKIRQVIPVVNAD